HVNPQYTGTFVFENDYAVLKADTPSLSIGEEGLLVAETESGRSRVLCFSPRHDLTLALMAPRDIEGVVDAWVSEFTELGRDPAINSVVIFENRGAMMGSSNAHPHGQIWANRSLPNEMMKECATQGAWFKSHGSTLLADYLGLELRKQERVVAANEHFVVLVPFWAVWPFETLLVSRRAMSGMDELTSEERSALAAILSELTIRYDNLFHSSFPYTMGFHQRPTDGEAHPGFHLHAHFYPPLLRSATVKKFMVGYEMMGMPQRDITAEDAAGRLREQPVRHY
ncbi:MAG TPA: galactose-1-phosphate uridylyltransferase, partial [Bryobacteraceae bacterium]|nr:galactose-1-phosphate uridylyltransferase [Bryobacteraceae bacterium]